MTRPQYTIKEYRNYVSMSRDKFVLVEGAQDKRALDVMLLQLKNRKIITNEDIHVDAAEMITASDRPGMGNRRKVEEVCRGMHRVPAGARMVGLVDREFRGFQFDEPAIMDRLAQHWRIHRLVWTAGHSIENYFLSPAILKSAFAITPVDIDLMAVTTRFDQIYKNAIRIAYLLTLVACRLIDIERAISAITLRIIIIKDDYLTLEFERLRAELRQRRFSGDLVDQAIADLRAWEQHRNLPDTSVMQRAIHGHLVMRFMWFAFVRCAIYYHRDPRLGHRLTQIGDDTQFNTAASFWIMHALDGYADFPRIVLELLGIDTKQGT